MIATQEQRLLRIALVEALRSGDYPQGKAKLCYKDAHGTLTWCCLGVAEKIAGVEPNFSTIPGSALFEEGFSQSTTALTDKVKHAYGFATESGSFKNDREQRLSSLMNLNDAGVSFKEIADIIESEPKGLFTTD